MRQDGDSTYDRTLRLTVPQVAGVMGISAEAVRQRIKRGTLTIERDSSGSVFVLLDGDSTQPNADRPSDMTGDSTALVEELRDRVRSLETQLSEERTANRENRRLLAAALERIPAIEPPEESSPEPREPPVMTSEEHGNGDTLPEPEQRRTWWRGWFGL